MKKVLIAVMTVALVSTAAVAQDKNRQERKGPPEGQGPRHMALMDEGREGGMPPMPFMKDLSPEKQEQVKAIMEKYSSRDKVKALMEENRKIMTAEKFDSKAFIKNSKKIKDLREDDRENRVKAMAEILSIMSVEERTKMVDAWESGKDRRDFKGSKDGQKKGDRKPEKKGEKKPR